MKRTINVPFRAAYDVSRPLYNALRDGCEQMEKQHEQIKIARDEMQAIHVNHQPQEFEQLLQNILQSCCLSLQSHVSIFQAAVQTLEVDPGQEIPKYHESFVETVSILSEAAKGVQRIQNDNKKSRDGPSSSSSSKSSSSSSSESGSDSGPEVPNSTKRNTDKTERGRSNKKVKIETVSSGSSESSEPSSTNSADLEKNQETVMKGKGKKLSKQAPKQSCKQPASPKAKVSTIPQNILPSTFQEEPKDVHKPYEHPTFKKPTTPSGSRRSSFEDISAEVSARLAAKAEKRNRKKDSKKRKRESIASSIFSPDPKATPEQARIEQPKKKPKLQPAETKEASPTKRKGEKIELPNKGKKQKVTPVADARPVVKEQVPQAAEKKANKSKRRRSSNAVEPQAPVTQPSTEDVGRRKKRKVA